MEKNIKLATYASRCIENEILMHIRKISNQKAEVSLDEPINQDGDGNELLLSDILGTGEDEIFAPLEAAADLTALRQALGELPGQERELIGMRYGLGRAKRTDSEGDRPKAWNIPVLHFPDWKKDPGKAAQRIPAADELRIMSLKNTYNCIDKNNGELRKIVGSAS